MYSVIQDHRYSYHYNSYYYNNYYNTMISSGKHRPDPSELHNATNSSIYQEDYESYVIHRDNAKFNETATEDCSSDYIVHLKWGAVTAVCIALVAYFCIMKLWGDYKKKQRGLRLQNRHREALAPFQLCNVVLTWQDPQQRRPPSYSEATGLYDLPPAYDIIIKASKLSSSTSTGIDNMAISVDEEPGMSVATPSSSAPKLENDKDSAASSTLSRF